MAAFQVEGEPEDSDWRRWTHAPDEAGQSRIIDGSDAEVATRFWRHYDRDFALAQGAGMNAFRMSVAWERIIDAHGQVNECRLGPLRRDGCGDASPGLGAVYHLAALCVARLARRPGRSSGAGLSGLILRHLRAPW